MPLHILICSGNCAIPFLLPPWPPALTNLHDRSPRRPTPPTTTSATTVVNPVTSFVTDGGAIGIATTSVRPYPTIKCRFSPTNSASPPDTPSVRSAPTMESLPPELRCQIADCLDIPSLGRLIRVSKDWNERFLSTLFMSDRHVGRSVLWALAVDNRKLFRTAIDHGVSTTTSWPPSWRRKHDLHGYTALQICIVRGYQDLARDLLTANQHSAEVSAICRRCKSTPPTDRFDHPARGLSLREPLLHLAICYSQWPMAKFLLQYAADTEDMPLPSNWIENTTQFDLDRCSCLFEICRISGGKAAFEFTEWLFSTGIASKTLPSLITSSLPNDFSSNTIELACRFGQYRLALLFVQLCVQVVPPPFSTILADSLIILALLRCSAEGSEDVVPRPPANEYRVFLSAQRGDFRHLSLLITTLLEHGVPVEEVHHRTGRTALHLAAMIGDLGVLEPILERSNVTMLNQPDREGLTPLCLSKCQARRLPAFAWPAFTLKTLPPPPQVGELLVPRWIRPLLQTLMQSMSFDCDDLEDDDGAPLRIQKLQTPFCQDQSSGQYWSITYRDDCIHFLHSSGYEALNLNGRDLCFVF